MPIHGISSVYMTHVKHVCAPSCGDRGMHYDVDIQHTLGGLLISHV